MKKEKELLLISSILGFFYILVSIALSFALKNVISNNTVSNIINIVLYVLGITSSVIFLILSKEKINIEKKKGLIIFSSIILFLINIVSGIIGFIVVHRINKKNMRELPKLEILKKHKWFIYILLFLLWIAVTFFISNYLPKKLYVIILEYVVLFLTSIIIFWEDLKRDFNYFKKYFKEYSSIVLKNYGKSFLVVAILTLSIRIYTGLNTSTNQTSLNTMFDKFPIFVALLAVVYAPVVEELLFRGVIRKFIKNKWVFIFTSGILFGLAHVIDSAKSFKEYLFVLVYSALGCFLAHTYYKTNNICTNIMFHFIQNLLAVLAMILLSFFPDIN